MAEEIDPGVAYLRALKQISPYSASAATPAPQTPIKDAGAGSATADPGGQFKGSEKRRSPRYHCEGSVQIREEGCDVHTWAAFTDVSLNGCYVEAQATYPVGAILHMKLDANGERVETKGSVRVSYPYLGMGIAFTEMSDENRLRLRALLATVSRSFLTMGPGIASSLPSLAPLDALPSITDPSAALKALTEFFESRQMLMREDFLRVVRKSQDACGKP
ncbi:MAG: PilZ domain-containing protein [Candidatus Sulfotelmatobacter sp.]